MLLLRGRGGERFRNCSLHGVLVAGTFLSLSLSLFLKRRERGAYLGGTGGWMGPVLNICVSEVALIFIRTAGLYEGGV